MFNQILHSYTGELAALLTALLWAFTAVSFEYAARIVGSLAVNIIRLGQAFILFSLFCWIYRGTAFPADASLHAWLWLSLSGIVGFSMGDLFLMKAFTVIGSRITMLIFSAVPIISAILGWIFLAERLHSRHILGIIITITGIIVVVLTRESGRANIRLTYSKAGILFALAGTLGQSIGLILSKYGMGSYDAFASSQIRIIAGLIGFIILFFPLKAWNRVAIALKNRNAMRFTTIGAVLGPFLGVSFSLIAIQHTAVGIAATIMSIVPIIIIPLAVVFFKEKVKFREITGACITVIGIYIMFI
jgi:drug/metabolite transporter (DMT)-like permease